MFLCALQDYIYFLTLGSMVCVGLLACETGGKVPEVTHFPQTGGVKEKECFPAKIGEKGGK